MVTVVVLLVQVKEVGVLIVLVDKVEEIPVVVIVMVVDRVSFKSM